MNDGASYDDLRDVRRVGSRSALAALFFASGVAGLTWQSLWTRELHLVFGTSTFAIATVLAAFMGGLALGSRASANWLHAVKRPLAVYGVLEILIGLYAFVFPWLLGFVEPVYLAAHRAFDLSPVAFGGVQFLLVGGLLLLPTAAMGATLPLVSRFVEDDVAELGAGDRIGWLYALNTGGAVVGTLVTGFWALPTFGVRLTAVLTALLNIGLGALAIYLQQRVGETATRERSVPSSGFGMVLFVAALAGFASLVYEVAWFRVLALMLGASTYAFSIMLVAFLLGIALGGRWGGRLADRLVSVGKLALGIAAVEIAVAILAYGAMWVFPQFPVWYVVLFDVFDAEAIPSMIWALSLLLGLIVMLPAAIAMGAAFPLIVQAAVKDASIGDAVGRVGAWNTIGSMVGAALAGFVLLPTLGVQYTVLLAGGVNVLAALLIGGGKAVRGAAIAAAALILLVRPPWDPLWMTAGMYKYVTYLDEYNREAVEKLAYADHELIFYEEGLSSVVTVVRNTNSGNMWLANNGKIDASTSADMPTQLLSSLLPFQFRQDTPDVMVIGLASGITAGALVNIPEIERLDIVELEPAIERAARLFGKYNNFVLDDPRVNLIGNDGRNQVLLAAPESYDIIVSEPSNPWITGVSNLFTREFFELGKSRLKPNGVWSQWIQLYGMDDLDVRSLLKTFHSVYPNVLVYTGADDADLLLIGSDAPLAGTDADVEKLLNRSEGVRADLAGVDIVAPVDLLARLIFDQDALERLEAYEEGFYGPVPYNTDDNLRVEFRAPMNIHLDTQTRNIEMIWEHVVPLAPRATQDVQVLVDLAHAAADQQDWDRAFAVIESAQALLPVEDPARAEIAAELEERYAEGQEEEED